MRRVALLVFGSFVWVATCCVSACDDSSSTDSVDAGATCDDRAISCRVGDRAPISCATAACGPLAAYCSVTHGPTATSQVPAGCVDLSDLSAGVAGCPPNATGPGSCAEFFCCPDVDSAAGDASEDASDASDAADASDASDASDSSDASDASSD